MDASSVMMEQGTYFVVQYRSAPSRNEVRNIGVALIAGDGQFGALKHLPPSQLSSRIRTQGILDAALVGLGRIVGDDPLRAAERLAAMSLSSNGSVLIGRPMPADLGDDAADTMDALYKALIAQRVGRPPGLSRGVLLDRVVDTFRKSGAPVRRGEYLNDYLIDAIVAPAKAPSTAIHVQSFAVGSRDWARAEKETGYFLHAIETLGVPALCVIQPPPNTAADDALQSYGRAERMIRHAGVATVQPSDVELFAGRFQAEEQLPLVMA